MIRHEEKNFAGGVHVHGGEDIIKRGYEPVVVEGHHVGPKEGVALIQEERRQVREKLPETVPIIDENPDYEEVLRQVKEFLPVHVVVGSEFGVPLAVRLAHDLGLPGNSPDRIAAMTQKDAMHEALRLAGIRQSGAALSAPWRKPFDAMTSSVKRAWW